ncbi:MAG: hypothetical protein M9904_07880 [Chitinophagaceae bacterium]|nr:hypothetical protein [Chitinophagaceae bacterium]
MEFENFVSSLDDNDPPAFISAYLQSLWYDARGDWNKAHEMVQDIHDSKASHIHAYLHRKEGDVSNARYWYTRAGKPCPTVTLQEEWASLVKALLNTV